MASTSLKNDNGYKTFLAGEALAQYTLVKLASGEVVYADGADECIGYVDRTVADGEYVSVKLKSAPGTHLIRSGAAITEGAVCYGAADGEVGATNTNKRRGIALTASAADGDVIEVLLDGVSIDTDT